MKIKELRLVDIIVKQDGDIVYQGKVEDAPEDLKDKEYKNIHFEGRTVEIEI